MPNLIQRHNSGKTRSIQPRKNRSYVSPHRNVPTLKKSQAYFNNS